MGQNDPMGLTIPDTSCQDEVFSHVLNVIWCQKCIKKAQKLGKKPGICQKIILHPNYDTYKYNFCHVNFKKYMQISKIGQKRIKRR